jgi:hypothetical protein
MIDDKRAEYVKRLERELRSVPRLKRSVKRSAELRALVELLLRLREAPGGKNAGEDSLERKLEEWRSEKASGRTSSKP